MVKKWFVLLLGLLLVSMVVGVGPSESGYADGGDDAEKATEVIGKYSPLDDEGKIDWGKYKPFATKAEARISSINLWLDENVGWMRYIFHMKPAVSLLFFINVYVILLFFVILFLNAEGLWFFIEKKGGQRVFGGSLFFIFMVVRLYYGLASVLYNWWLYFWNIFVEASLWIGIIGFVVFCLILIFSFPTIGIILVALGRYQAAKKAARDKIKMATQIEVMDKFVEQATKSS